MTREEKQIEDNQRCQLARLACVLFRSENQSIQKNMDDVLCFHACLWLPGFSYRNTQHPVSDACLLSLADIAGILSEAARPRVVNIKMFDICHLSSATLRLSGVCHTSLLERDPDAE